MKAVKNVIAIIIIIVGGFTGIFALGLLAFGPPIVLTFYLCFYGGAWLAGPLGLTIHSFWALPYALGWATLWMLSAFFGCMFSGGLVADYVVPHAKRLGKRIYNFLDNWVEGRKQEEVPDAPAEGMGI